MLTWNLIWTRVFDVLLAPFGHGPAWFDLTVWSVIAGVIALLVYKRVSNQRGITRAKDRIQAHLYEIRLFRHDPLVVMRSSARVLGQNLVYLAYNLVPMAVLTVPMLTVLAQLEAHYAFDPVAIGSVEMLSVKLDPHASLAPRDVTLTVPDGVVLDAPPVRTPDGEIFWRLRATAAGDHALALAAGGQTITKTWSVGGAHRKVSVKRTKTWEAFLYPGEAMLSSSSPIRTVEIRHPERPMGILPHGEMGVLTAFFALSLAAGFVLKDRFGVTL